MVSKVNPIPAGYHSVIPYLIVDNGTAALEFYKRALEATEVMRHCDASGRVCHAEMKIGDAHIMLADEFAEMGFKSAKSIGGTPVSVMVYLANVDAAANRFVELGAEVMKPIADQFYGDRSATFRDPFGHIWTIATHIEDVSPEEMGRRMKALGH